MAMPVDHLLPDLRRQAKLIYYLEFIRAPVVRGWFVHLSSKVSPQKRLRQPHPIPNKNRLLIGVLTHGWSPHCMEALSNGSCHGVNKQITLVSNIPSQVGHSSRFDVPEH
jgi:hypothetical protein